MMSSVISAAILTPVSTMRHSNSVWPRLVSTFSSRGRASLPVRNARISAIARQRLPARLNRGAQVFKALDHGRVVEAFEPFGIFEINAARKHLHHAMRRAREHVRRRVAGKHDRRNPALPGLGIDITGKGIRDAIDELGDRIGACRRHHHRMINAVVELAHGNCTRGLVAQNAHVWRKIKLQLVHAQHFLGCLRDKHVAMLKRPDHLETLDEEVTRPGKHPGPARCVQLAHATTSACLKRVPGSSPLGSIFAASAKSPGPATYSAMPEGNIDGKHGSTMPRRDSEKASSSTRISLVCLMSSSASA